MRLLAVSDIHGNVDAVRRLVRRRREDLDAVIAAGDIGSKAAPEILRLLASLGRPVLYVFGNWDSKLPYDTSFGPNCHHLHLTTFEQGGWTFTGFSGVRGGWGMNPFAKRRETSPGAVQRKNRGALAKLIRALPAGLERTVVVTHERQHRVHEDLAGVPLFLFGHQHGFHVRTFKGATFVNVSALDDALPPRDGVAFGTYTMIDLGAGGIAARSVRLGHR
jgi:predicted phosphodiesterase